MHKFVCINVNKLEKVQNIYSKTTSQFSNIATTLFNNRLEKDITEIKATMSDIENRERAINEYIDRAISDSTHARFDETNNRIDAIDSRLDTPEP